MQAYLKARISAREATIAVIGLGYVGLPLLLRFAASGFRTIALDRDSNKIAKLKHGSSYIDHIPTTSVESLMVGGKCLASTDLRRVSDADAIILCLPTPLNEYREPDLSYVLDTVDELCPYLRTGQLLSLESTTYPGTTNERLRPRIESLGLSVGEDFFLVYSPEREDPANPNFNIQSILKVSSGITSACRALGKQLYEAIVDQVVPVSSTQAAELTKLLENIHRAVNIGLVNEMKMVAERMSIDIYEVIDAAATKPFGFVPYYPGPGLGGHCIPIDPFYLTWKARQFGVNTRFIELAGEINRGMPEWVMAKLGDALNFHRKSIRGSRILVLGIAYKKNVGDTRESPAVVLMEHIREKGGLLTYSGPHVPNFPPMREHKFDLSSISLSSDIVNDFDCVLLATDHDDFDYDMIQEAAKLIIDTRGVYRDCYSNVVKA